MLLELSMALAGLKAASGGVADATSLVEHIKKAFSAPEVDVTEAKQLSLELLNILIDTKTAQMTIQDQLLALQQELQKQDRFTTQAARYELTQTDMGATIYTLKEDDETGDASHDICADCFEDAIKSHLQPVAHNTLGCNRCGGKFLKKDGRSSGIMSVPSRRGLGNIDDY